MKNENITQEQIQHFLGNPGLDFVHAPGVTDATKRSLAWNSIRLAQLSKSEPAYKIVKKAVKKLHDKVIFEHASFNARTVK